MQLPKRPRGAALKRELRRELVAHMKPQPGGVWGLGFGVEGLLTLSGVCTSPDAKKGLGFRV